VRVPPRASKWGEKKLEGIHIFGKPQKIPKNAKALLQAYGGNCYAENPKTDGAVDWNNLEKSDRKLRKKGKLMPANWGRTFIKNTSGADRHPLEDQKVALQKRPKQALGD